MAYIVGTDRYQTRMVTTSLDDLISKDNSVRVIDSYVESLNLENLGFIEYSGRNRGQSPYRRSDLLKLHNTYPIVPDRNLPLISGGMTAHCCSLISGADIPAFERCKATHYTMKKLITAINVHPLHDLTLE